MPSKHGGSWACAPAKSTDGPVAHAISLLSIAAIVVPSKAKISQIQQASESRWPIFPIGSKFKVMPVSGQLTQKWKKSEAFKVLAVTPVRTISMSAEPWFWATAELLA
jgi:hypothetical protein